VKSLDPLLLLVKFKLEVGRTRTELLEIARRSRAHSDAELIVANDLTQLEGGRHPALLLDMCGLVAEVDTTAGLAERLAEEIAARLHDLPLRSVPLPPLAAVEHGQVV
jgi:phosphopantothenate-cysteine ligase